MHSQDIPRERCVRSGMSGHANKQTAHPSIPSVRERSCSRQRWPASVHLSTSSCHPRLSQAFPETFPERRTQAKNPKESLILEQTEWSNHATIKHKIRRQARRQASDSSIPLPCWLSSPLPSWLFSCQTTRQLVCNSAKIQPCFDFGPTFCAFLGLFFEPVPPETLVARPWGPDPTIHPFFGPCFARFSGLHHWNPFGPKTA